MNAVQVISGAITALETYGHARGKFLDRTTGQLCLAGALSAGHNSGLLTVRKNPTEYAFRPVAVSGEPFHNAMQHVVRAIAARYADSDRPPPSVAYWNDVHCDGKEDAILLLKEALVLAEAAEATGVQGL